MRKNIILIGILVMAVGCGVQAPPGAGTTAGRRFVVDASIPSPTGVQAQRSGSQPSVTVTWEYSAPTIGFYLEELLDGPSIDSAGWQPVTLTDGATRSFTVPLEDRSYPAGTRLSFRVSAVRGHLQSPPSAEAGIPLDGSAPALPTLIQNNFSGRVGRSALFAHLVFRNHAEGAILALERLVSGPNIDSVWTKVSSESNVGDGDIVEFFDLGIDRTLIEPEIHYSYRVRVFSAAGASTTPVYESRPYGH